MLRRPETLFTAVDDAEIAVQTLGSGPVDLLVLGTSATNVDVWWEYSGAAQTWTNLSSLCRVILFDRRGVGASERYAPESLPSLSEWRRDALAVLDFVGSRRAVVLAVLDGGIPALELAVTEPARVAGLVMARTTARLRPDRDYPGTPDGIIDEWISRVERTWGRDGYVRAAYPDASDPEFLDWSVRSQRAAGTGKVIASFLREWSYADVRTHVPDVRTPTLVVQRPDAVLGEQHARYLIDHIAAAEAVTVKGRGALLEVIADLHDPLARFLGGSPAVPPKVVMFTDIVGSTRRALALGDDQWALLLDQHDRSTREVVHGRGGTVLKSTGDGALCLFDDASAAILAATELRDLLKRRGLLIRCGLHAGPLVDRGTDVGGATVHAAARIAAAAADGCVLISEEVREMSDLVVELGPRQHIAMKGFSGDAVAYEVLQLTHLV